MKQKHLIECGISSHQTSRRLKPLHSVYVAATVSSSQNLYSLSPLPLSPTHSPKIRRRCSDHDLPIKSTRLPAQTRPSHGHFGVDCHRRKWRGRSSSNFHGRPPRYDVVSRHAQWFSPQPSLPSSNRENHHQTLPRPWHWVGFSSLPQLNLNSVLVPNE